MTTQPAIGSLIMTDRTEIPLGPTTLTDAAAAAEITTDPAFSVVAQSIGDYAPGKTIKSALVTAKTHIAFCYVLRQGLVAALIPVASRTAGGNGAPSGALPLCKPFTLQPGDKIVAFVEA